MGGSRPGSTASVYSARSEQSKAKLAMRQRHEERKNQILLDLQRRAKVGGRHMSPEDFAAMSTVASEEATRQITEQSVTGATGLLSEVAQRRSARAAAKVERAQRAHESFLPPIDGPNETMTPRGGGDTGAIKPHYSSRRNLRVDVTGKGMPLTTMIVEKLAQRGEGGPQSVRKAFKTVDSTGRGFVTFEQLQELLVSINLHVSARSLERAFLKWSGGEPQLNYNKFIEQVMPRDFTAEPYEAKKRRDKVKAVRTRITNMRDWEAKFREKLVSKTKGGTLELRNFWRLFDLDRDGIVTVEEIFAVTESWHLYASDSVKQQFRAKYCKDPSSTNMSFYDFAEGVSPKDYQSSNDVLVMLRDKVQTNWSTVREAFLSFDSDPRDGTLSVAELQEALVSLNIEVSQLALAAVFRFADKDQDAKITFEEFASAIKRLDTQELPGLGGKLMWDVKQDPRKKPPPPRPASIMSDADEDHEQEPGGESSGGGGGGDKFGSMCMVDLGGADGSSFVVNTAPTSFSSSSTPATYR